MKRQQSGFTLIELVMVIVILGILSVIAIPQFINMRGEARTAATQGVAGALSAAAAINYAGCQTDNAALCTAVDNCDDVDNLLQGGAAPTGYTVTPAAIASGATANCTVTGPGSTTATFVGYGT